jgi:hypothetical protein
MRTTTRLAAAAFAAGTALLAGAGAGTASADTASPSPGASDSGSAPTEAGTTFRTATVLKQGQTATANASTGDYLYWVFPATAGQNATAKATVTLPESATRHGSATWQLDVYDGLRRRQPCRFGRQTRTAAADAPSVALTCKLRAIRAWAEPWSNDPLRGAYYVRLTVLDLPPVDLGLPVQAAVLATSDGTAGRQAVDGSVTPVVPADSAAVAPSGGWAGTWWSPRWLWSGGGGLLAALVAVGAHRLARGPVGLRARPAEPYPRESSGYVG